MLITLFQMKSHMHHIQKIANKKQSVNQHIPYLKENTFWWQYYQILNKCLFDFVFEMLATFIIIIWYWLIRIIPHYFLCHFSFIIRKCQKVYLKPHISYMWPQFRPVVPSSRPFLRLRKLRHILILLSILRFLWYTLFKTILDFL